MCLHLLHCSTLLKKLTELFFLSTTGVIQFYKNRVRVPSQCLGLSPLHLPYNAHNGSPYQSENRHPKVHREGWKPITSPPQGHHYVSSVSLPVRTGGSNRAVAMGKDREGNQSQKTTKIQTPGLQVARLQNYATSSSQREIEQVSTQRKREPAASHAHVVRSVATRQRHPTRASCSAFGCRCKNSSNHRQNALVTTEVLNV